jgi:CubicO group peptidase (beta-lactamase class C family)
MRRLIIAVLFAASCTFDVFTQAKPLDGFDDDVAKAVKDWRTPGLAVAVIKNDEIVFEHGYGVRELGKPAAVDTHTLFAIGSTTKAMTATLAAMLVDEKKLEWDAPVTRYLPWFQMKDPAVSREVTVRDLLTHRAGLGNADYLWYGQHSSTEEILRRVRLIDPAYPVRSGFIYQNIMYAAAGAVVESASGRSWPELIRTRIFEPLGMKDSQATAARLASLPNVASPHSIVDGRVRVIENASVDPVAAAGAVWSSVDDMSKWMKFMLDGGRAGGRSGTRLLSEESFRELFTPQTIAPYEMYPTTRLTKPHWMTYGLGWFQQDYRGQALDFHTGSIDGMVAIHGLVRDENLGVYVLGNLDHAEVRHAIMYSVIDRYAGRQDHDWSVEFLKLYDGLKAEADQERAKRNAARVTGTTPSVPLAKFTGTYGEPLHGEVNVTQAGAGLRLQYGSAFVGPLEHWHYNTFRANWEAAWREPDLVTFVIDADGRPNAIEMSGARFIRVSESKGQEGRDR